MHKGVIALKPEAYSSHSDLFTQSERHRWGLGIHTPHSCAHTKPTRTHTCTHTHAHSHTCTHTHAHTRTHTHAHRYIHTPGENLGGGSGCNNPHPPKERESQWQPLSSKLGNLPLKLLQMAQFCFLFSEFLGDG